MIARRQLCSFRVVMLLRSIRPTSRVGSTEVLQCVRHPFSRWHFLLERRKRSLRKQVPSREWMPYALKNLSGPNPARWANRSQQHNHSETAQLSPCDHERSGPGQRGPEVGRRPRWRLSKPTSLITPHSKHFSKRFV